MDKLFKFFLNGCYPTKEVDKAFNSNKLLTIQNVYCYTIHPRQNLNLDQHLDLTNLRDNESDSEITVKEPRSQPIIFKNKTRKSNSVIICSKDNKINESKTDSNYILPDSCFDFSKKKIMKSLFFSTEVFNNENFDFSEVSEDSDKEKLSNVIQNDDDSLNYYDYFINSIPIAVDCNSEKQNKTWSLLQEVKLFIYII